MNIPLARYKLSKVLLWLANQVDTRTPNWPRYQAVNNIDNFSLEYLQSYDKEQPLKQIWEGWEDVTDENAQEVIDDLRRAVDFAHTKKEQEKLNE